MKFTTLFLTLSFLIFAGTVSAVEIHTPTVTPTLQPKYSNLPILPTGYQSPRFHGLPIQVKSALELKALFETTNSTLHDLRTTLTATPFIFKNMPVDFKSLPVKEKTSTFIALMTPHIIEVNNDVLEVRAMVKTLQQKVKTGTPLTPDETQWIEFVSHEMRLKTVNYDTLYNRINAIPVALVLAQAITESGWGTSRFARDGNAIFGQHASRNGKLNYIVSKSGTAKVAAFDDLYLCMAGYILNLNRNGAYKKLRAVRSSLEKSGKPITGTALAEGLIRYSERGQIYVDELRQIIRKYQLEQLNNCVLDTSKDPAYYLFTR